MLIVLPPSETKAVGGESPALDLGFLSFPELSTTRGHIIRDLSALEVDNALGVLGISEKLRGEAEANLHLFSSPTMPAIHRYTGVLFDALSPATLGSAALERIAIGSALFGVLRATDLIPHYRLSGGTKLPAMDIPEGPSPTMKARWGRAITESLSAVDELIVDLRSGTYQQLGKVPGAVTVRVESVLVDGTRKVVSHFNKQYKGELARVLAQSPTDATSAAGVASIARGAGLTVEETSGTSLTLVV